MQTDWQRSLDAFHAVSSSADEVLSDVYERETDGSVDGLALVFTHRVLLFEADGEDDTISVRWKPISRFRSDGLKSVRSAIDGNDLAGARSALKDTISLIDKMASKGLIHRNAAGRYKSRLTTRLGARA